MEPDQQQSVQQVTVHRVAWDEMFHFPKLCRAWSISIQPNRVIMGLILIVVLMISGGLWDAGAGLFSGGSDATQVDEGTTPPRVPGTFEICVEIVRGRAQNAAMEVGRLDVLTAVRHALIIPIDLVTYTWVSDRAFFIVFGLWFLLVWCIGTGMIARSVACEFAVMQPVPWTQALAFSLNRITNSFGAFLTMIVFIVVASILLAIGGLLFRVPVLDVLAALLYGLAIIGSLVAVALLLLGSLGSVLIVPAVAVESADMPDAISRAFSYVKNRPLHYVLYLGLATLLGVVAYSIVTFVLAWTLNFAAWGAGLFLDSDLATYAGGANAGEILADKPSGELASGTDRVAAEIIGFWRTVIGAVLAGFVVSYISTASTIAYFLLRKATDDQDMDEIWLPGMIEGTLAPEHRDGSTQAGATA